MMMPPKKSKAARESGVFANHSDTQPRQNGEEEKEAPEVNVFKVEILLDKRQRQLPLGEQKFEEWVKEHFEESDEEGVKVSLSDAFEAYRTMCSESATPAFDTPAFYKMMKDHFSKNFRVKEDSPYKTSIKEKRPKLKKSDGDKPKKEKGDAEKLDLKDILERAMNDFGNPTKGVRFASLKTHVGSQYPSLRIEQRPHFLQSLLERGVKNRFLECVKGIGRCGFYRLPGPPTPEEQEKEEKLKEKKAKGPKKEKEGKSSGEEGEEGSGDTAADNEGKEEEEARTEEATEEGASGDKKKLRGRKTKTKAESKRKPKGKGKKKKARAKVYRSYIIHSDPQRIEETFPLAMTYMCEPKEASTNKIKKYIEKYYRQELAIDKLRKAIDSGLEKGFWSQISGSGMSGKYRLEIDEFDPTDDDDLIGQIVNALVACTEPKFCSSRLLKRYLSDYHTQFETAEKPYLYKKALQRGIKKNIIKQISGIGSSGSFQLADEFMPSPTILHGDDAESDYNEPDLDSDDERLPEYDMDINKFRDAYVPRPSKRRGHARKSAVLDIEKTQVSMASTYKRGRPKLKQKGALRQARSRLYDSSSEEESSDESSEEEEVAPPRRKVPVSRGRGRAATKKAAPKKAPAKRATPAAKKRAAPKSGGGRSARSPRKSYAEDADSDVSEAGAPTTGRSPRSPKKSYVDLEEAYSSEEEAVPIKKARKAPAKKKAAAKKGKKGKRQK